MAEESKFEHPPKRGLTPEQIAAIRFSKKIGRRIAVEYPEVAEDYRAGSTLKKIVKDYGFVTEYGLSFGIACAAVYHALREFVPLEELRELEHVHESEAGQKTYEQRKGIHALTPEQLAEAGRKGGKKSGPKIYEQHKGLFSLTPEQRRDTCRKGGQKGGKKGGRTSTIERGQIPWSDEEKAYLHELYQSPEYRTPEGFIDYDKISQELEQKFGTERTKMAVKAQAYCLGIHAFTQEESAEFHKSRTRKAVLSHGQIPWSNEEKMYLCKVSQDPQYRTPQGIDWNEISTELERAFGTKRTACALQHRYRRFRKSAAE